jgi:hypothetical protein
MGFEASLISGGWPMLLSNEGSLSLPSRPARLLAGWAHDTTAVGHGEVQAWGRGE